MDSGDPGRGGWRARQTKEPQKNKINLNILRQEKLIAQKKQEIEARMAEQAKLNAQAMNKPLPASSPSFQGGSSNKFANDGSFLQQFMKMQKEKSSNTTASPSDNKTSSSSPSPGGQSAQKRSVFVGQRPGLGVSSMLSQFKSYSQSKKSPVLSQRPSVFCSPDDEDEDEEADYSKFLDMKVSPPEDTDTRLIIDKMASFVAEGGAELENKAREDYKDNPVFSFLYEKGSLEHLYYKKRVAELRKALHRAEEASAHANHQGATEVRASSLRRLNSKRVNPADRDSAEASGGEELLAPPKGASSTAAVGNWRPDATFGPRTTISGPPDDFENLRHLLHGGSNTCQHAAPPNPPSLPVEHLKPSASVNNLSRVAPAAFRDTP